MVTAKPNLHQLYESQSETITEFLNNWSCYTSFDWFWQWSYGKPCILYAHCCGKHLGETTEDPSCCNCWS